MSRAVQLEYSNDARGLDSAPARMGDGHWAWQIHIRPHEPANSAAAKPATTHSYLRLDLSSALNAPGGSLPVSSVA